MLGLHDAVAECRFEPGPEAAPLASHAPAAGVVILELRLVGQEAPPTALLEVLAERGIHATVLASASWADRHSSALGAYAQAGHEIGYWALLREDLHLTGTTSVPPDLGRWVRGLRQGRKAVRRAAKTRVRTIGLRTLPHIGEIAIEGLGFRTVLPAERTVADLPRRSASLHSIAGRARVLGEGPYTDGCGAMLPAWTPAALDRATGVAARAHWVRIGLPPDPTAAPLLARWLDEVVLPQGWTVLTAFEAGQRSRPSLSRPTLHSTETPQVAVARRVDASAWGSVARTLAEADTLPRLLPGDLTPTEAFLGLTQILAADTTPEAVTLGALSAPSETARTGLGSQTLSLTPETVRQAARDLLPGLTGHVPSLVAVGSRSVTAAEFLRLMALVYLNHPPEARAVTDPDPFAPGGGWGESRGR